MPTVDGGHPCPRILRALGSHSCVALPQDEASITDLTPVSDPNRIAKNKRVGRCARIVYLTGECLSWIGWAPTVVPMQRISYYGHAMGGVSIWRVLIGLGTIVLIFALFGFLMWQARRTHTRKIGGRTYWDIIYGRFPKIRRPRHK